MNPGYRLLGICCSLTDLTGNWKLFLDVFYSLSLSFHYLRRIFHLLLVKVMMELRDGAFTIPLPRSLETYQMRCVMTALPLWTLYRLLCSRTCTLGPIFPHIKDVWLPRNTQMVDFWSSRDHKQHIYLLSIPVTSTTDFLVDGSFGVWPPSVPHHFMPAPPVRRQFTRSFLGPTRDLETSCRLATSRIGRWRGWRDGVDRQMKWDSTGGEKKKKNTLRGWKWFM